MSFNDLELVRQITEKLVHLRDEFADLCDIKAIEEIPIWKTSSLEVSFRRDADFWDMYDDKSELCGLLSSLAEVSQDLLENVDTDANRMHCKPAERTDHSARQPPPTALEIICSTGDKIVRQIALEAGEQPGAPHEDPLEVVLAGIRASSLYYNIDRIYNESSAAEDILGIVFSLMANKNMEEYTLVDLCNLGQVVQYCKARRWEVFGLLAAWLRWTYLWAAGILKEASAE